MIGKGEATNWIDIEIGIVRAAVIADITRVLEATCLAIFELQDALPALPEAAFETRMPTLSATLEVFFENDEVYRFVR